ncbi:low affinity immunoglobulin gamma Fc region receptor II-b-like isoform X2 [Melanotaenia boesemani]|uniref:low affinity immunoglobulin gamma Fc region receptor II-b-like isoform X2 n=1 Tax=Melanotaenia boesemani TaxID=1250792 RepID=UPI001C04FA52|nr:low affinity immunoglobulin gamma Fc region receptor II-b-like isoform X2 [Melanotaenia boesemani]
MEITLCAVIASLSVIPNKSQFFRHDSLSLSCEQRGHSSEWRVKRNTSTKINEDCSSAWNRGNQSHCLISPLYEIDSGVYWCESGADSCSNTVNISVTSAALILESPALPVNVGEAVTMRCRHKTTSSSNLTHFYKDEHLIVSSLTGNLTIRSVSKSDEGLYKCSISGAGESLESWLTVRGHPEVSAPQLAHIILPVVGVCLLLISLMLLCLWRTHKGKLDAAVSYTDVTITQEAEPHRLRVTTASFFRSIFNKRWELNQPSTQHLNLTSADQT